MKASILSDKDYQNGLFQNLKGEINTLLDHKGFETEFMEIGQGDLAFCMGCFGCWTKKPGECMVSDRMASINRKFVQSDVFIYLSPVVFGQFSANIKNALDRWIPNILPFFEVRPDGSTMHPSRYDALPKVIIIGYGDGLLEEDVQLFTDITKKHRRGVEVFVYQGEHEKISGEFSAMNFGKVGPEL